jgi:spermidine synthase
MSFVLTAILAYQSIHGYVYEMIGMLSASFMIGLWAGTSITTIVRRPLKTLFLLEMCTIFLAALSLFLFKADFILYLLVFFAGLISGAQFSTANLSLGKSTNGGRLYALDLLGSFLGVLISSLIVIPLIGIPSTLILIAVIKAFSAMLIWSLKPFSTD